MASSVVAIVSINSCEYCSIRSVYCSGTSTSSYSPVLVPCLYMWHFLEKILTIP